MRNTSILRILAFLLTLTSLILMLSMPASAATGDVDQNGSVNVGDIMKLKNLIMTARWSSTELSAADMNNDRRLDVADIMALKNIIMGSTQTVYGASSMQELIRILSSDYLFTEDQMRCMTVPMYHWAYNHGLHQGVQSSVPDRNYREISQVLNNYLFEIKGAERMKINVGQTFDCDFDLYSNAFMAECKKWDDQVYAMIVKEKNNLQGVWAANVTYRGESGVSFTVRADDYEMDMDMDNDFYIYKIDGRYYWSYIGIYK